MVRLSHTDPHPNETVKRLLVSCLFLVSALSGGEYIQAARAFQEMAEIKPNPRYGPFEDRHYYTIDSLDEVFELYWEIEWRYNLRYLFQVWDCDDRAGLWIMSANAVLHHKGVQRSAAAWYAAVEQRVRSLGIPGGNQQHAVVILKHTTKGWLVLDPATRHRMPLKAYPNKILYVYRN